MGVGYFQIRVDENVQIEKDFPAHRAGPQLVPLPDRNVGVDDFFDVLDRVRIDGGFGQLAQRIADDPNSHPYNHQPNGNRSDLVAMAKTEFQRYKSCYNRDRTESVTSVMPGVGVKCGAVGLNRDFLCCFIEPLLSRN